jgi:hypothetical protein
MRSATLLLAILTGLTSVVLAGPAFADVRYTVTFDPSQVSVQSREGFDAVKVEGCRFELVAGNPMIPVLPIHFSIPAGMQAASIDVRVLSQTRIPGEFYLEPSQPPVRLSDEYPAEFIDANPEVYESASPYPGLAAELVNNGNMGGYAVVGVRVFPLEYYPTTGEVFLNEEVEIRLALEHAAEPALLITGRTEAGERAMADRVRALVVNPQNVSENIGPRMTDTKQDPVEYAIITGSSYTDEFQPLADWKTKKGVNTEIFTTTWIYSNYTGTDNQEKIRNFIKDYEANHGLVYVLLGGDDDVVPARTAWDDLGYDGIRADLYFSDTDGTWNADGDSRWGEHPADNVDMYGDIYVGRAPVNTSSEVTNFVNKVLTYEGSDAGSTLPTDYQEDMLFMAEVLWGPPEYPYSDGGVSKNMIDDGHVPPRFDPITKLYEDTGNLSYSAAMAAMNDGPGITNHCGHCNYNVMSINPDALYNGDMDILTNGDRQGIFYTIGCWAAAFDYDNIAEHYVNNPNGGGVAFVGNSRYGWGCPGYPGECVSDLYDLQFFRALFTSDLYNIGITHADAKDFYVPDSQSDEYMRYGLYELNVLGCPEMPIWTRTPQTLTVSHPSTLPTGSSYFTVQVNTAKAPVEDATVCLMKGTEVYLVGTTNSSGELTLEPAPDTGGTMTVTVSKHDYLPYEGEATIEVGTPPSAPTGLAAVAGNGQVDLSWNSNPEPDLDYYIIYRSTHPNATDSLTAVSSPGYLDTGVVNDTTYYYRLRAVDTEGDRSVYSSEVSATPTQPPVIFITHTPLTDTENANTPLPVVATITSTETSLDPDSLLVIYETQTKAWLSTVMTPTGTPDEYSGSIPGQPCGTLVNYYILAVDQNHNRETHPDLAPGNTHSFSVNFSVVFDDDFESHQGWTVGDFDDDATTGVWERCDPEWTEAQPEDDHTPSPGVNAYITQCAAGSSQGSYDIDGGKTTLFSPVFDLSTYSSAAVSYYRWYSNDTGSAPDEDYWVVQVTDDGWSTWATLENTNVSNRNWTQMQFDVGSYVSLNDQVQFRFIASDEGSGSLVEAGLDDFTLGGCSEAADTEPPVVTVLDPNGGELLTGGQAYDIEWTATDNVGVTSTTILLSTNGGSTYPTTIASGSLASPYSWDVPNVDEASCRIKVLCQDAALNEGSDESDADFEIQWQDYEDPVVTVVDPDGGEQLPGGAPYDIEWTATDNVGVVTTTILLSTDGGGTYPTTIASGSLSSPYSWAVPNVDESSCRIKVVCVDAATNEGSDESDADFEIQWQDYEDPVVTVLDPNGGEQLPGAEPYDIEWTATDNVGVINTTILLSTDGGATFPTTIASGSLTSPYTWAVPNVDEASCRIKVVCTDAATNEASDESDADFEIQWQDIDVPVVTVIDPNGGEQLPGGQSFDIEWSATDNVGITNTEILLSTDGGGTYPTTIASGSLTSPYTWAVPNVGETSCRIKVVCHDAELNEGSDESDADFEILWQDYDDPVVTVIDPNGGEQLPGGAPYDIEWTATDNVGVTNTTILLSTDGGGTYPTTIASGSLTSPHTWAVPNVNEASCRIKVVCVDAATNEGSDESDADFEILWQDYEDPVVTVVDPNGGEELQGGESYDVEWTASDNVGVTSTTILLSIDGGSTYPTTIASGALTSPHAWDVPDVDESSCRIKVVCVDAATNEGSDESDEDFVILPMDHVPPTVTVLDPNGGEEVAGGEPYVLQWTSSDNIGVVSTTILLSTDGGVSFGDTLASGGLDSTFLWDVPDVNEVSCRIKVVCLDAESNEGSDESDADFQVLSSSTSVAGYGSIPVELVLRQNRPNPFNPVTEIEFGLPGSQSVSLEVYNIEGRLITTLARGVYSAGYHTVVWRGTDDQGVEVSTGVYFYRLVTGETVLTKKMLMLK